MKREFLQLAHTYDPDRHGVAGWYMSEKLDGMRAFWDGGWTRGIPASEVPFANVEKDGRYVRPPVATGLWSRYGNVICAPDWWLDELPRFPLDGELYAGRGSFQHLVSVTKRLEPGPEWSDISYAVFDVPPYGVVLADGEIKNTNFKKVLRGAANWWRERATGVIPQFTTFDATVAFMRRTLTHGIAHFHPQEQLPFNTAEARERVRSEIDRLTDLGGEGVMLRRPASCWTAARVHDLLKVKKLREGSGVVVGYTWGRETELGSKLLGKMGALRLIADNGIVFELSGFTDEERTMAPVETWTREMASLDYIAQEGAKNAGRIAAKNIHNPRFPVGTRVEYAYRELTNDGAPKEARYLRKP